VLKGVGVVHLGGRVDVVRHTVPDNVHQLHVRHSVPDNVHC